MAVAVAPETAWVELSAGPIEYRDTGGTGPVLVLLHGLAMDGELWRDVVAELTPSFRCVLPTLPFGSHRRPMHRDADLSLRGQGRIIAEFLERLELRDVTLVFNDWGGAQTMIADGLMDRVGRLVLTPREAFENYPPGLAGRMAALSAKVPGGMLMMRWTLLIKPLRALPFIYGQMSKRGVDDATMHAWLEPLKRSEIRRDLARYCATARQGARDMRAATNTLAGFTKPVLVVWGSEGKMMPPAHGPALAACFPDARLVELPDSYTLMPIDQPVALARGLKEFAGG